MTETTPTIEAAPPRQLAPVALGAATLAVVAWSFGPIFVREVGASTPTVVFWRMWCAQPVMFAVAYITGGRMSMALLRRCVVPGALFAASLATSFASFQHTSIANATLIGALQPALILVVAPRMFGDRSSRSQIALATLAFVGMSIVVLGAGKTSGASWLGDLYALANLGLWTVYFIRVKRVRNDGVHAAAFLAGVFFIAALTVTPWALLISGDLGTLGFRGFGFVMLMVLGPGVLGHGSMTWAQRHLDITVASLITLLQPVIATVLAWWIFGESLRAVQIVGAAIVLTAIGGIVRQTRRMVPAAEDGLSVVAD